MTFCWLVCFFYLDDIFQAAFFWILVVYQLGSHFWSHKPSISWTASSPLPFCSTFAWPAVGQIMKHPNGWVINPESRCFITRCSFKFQEVLELRIFKSKIKVAGSKIPIRKKIFLQHLLDAQVLSSTGKMHPKSKIHSASICQHVPSTKTTDQAV